MKHPRTAYVYWTEFHDPSRYWITYCAFKHDEDGEPLGEDCSAATPEESLDAAMRMAEDLDDGKCKHGTRPQWCDLCEDEREAEGALG